MVKLIPIDDPKYINIFIDLSYLTISNLNTYILQFRLDPFYFLLTYLIGILIDFQ
jgi:hypothetical protein